MKIMSVVFSLVLGFSAATVFAEESQRELSDAELEQILAPIALYPDSLLTHILISATYPLEVVQADRWWSENQDMEPSDAQQQMEDKPWDPSVKALIPFPGVIERLSGDLDWTQRLGDAFLQDEERVLASIQALRLRADREGNLDRMTNNEVIREEGNIIIQPLEREVVYVPYYDTRVVYGNWRWRRYPPVCWDWDWGRYRHHYHGSHYDTFSWYPAVHLSHRVLFSAFHWHHRHIVLLDRHHYHRGFHHSRGRHHHHIIKHKKHRRWRHNPAHRRGVAYHNSHLRTQFGSNRRSARQSGSRQNSSGQNRTIGRDQPRLISGKDHRTGRTEAGRDRKYRNGVSARRPNRTVVERERPRRQIRNNARIVSPAGTTAKPPRVVVNRNNRDQVSGTRTETSVKKRVARKPEKKADKNYRRSDRNTIRRSANNRKNRAHRKHSDR